MSVDYLKNIIGKNQNESASEKPSTFSGLIETPKSDIDFSKFADSITGNTGVVDAEEYNKLADLNVFINSKTTQEEINKTAAENQSAFKQFGNFLGQAGLNEIVIGSALGILDTFDSLINITRDAAEEQYQNAATKYLTKVQEDVREKFKIYRENPGKAWDVTDSGWWFENAISIASTASMLIPTKAITGAFGLLAKGARSFSKVDKVIKGVDTAIPALMKKAGVKNPLLLYKDTKNLTEIGTMAALSRNMENYREAREVYNEAYQMSVDRFATMTDEEREAFNESNPELANLTSDEERAKTIASNAADKTYAWDFALLALDFMQFRALGSMMKPTRTAFTGRTLRRMEANARRELAGITEAPKLSLAQRTKEFLSDVVHHPTNTLSAIQLSEGLEEGFQAAMTTVGKEEVDLTFDDKYQRKTIGDHLSDGLLWEQAFWGVLGGAAFQAVGKGLGHLERTIKNKDLSKRLTPQELELYNLGEEQYRGKEIQNRKVLAANFLENIEKIESGINPFSLRGVSDTIKTESEKQELYDEAVNKYATDLVLAAADANNYKGLRDYISDPNFNKYLNKGLQTLGIQDFSKELLAKTDGIIEIYEQTKLDLINNVDIANPSAFTKAARDITKAKFGVANERESISKEWNALEQHTDFANITQKDKIRIKRNVLLYKIKELDDKIKELDKVKFDSIRNSDDRTVSKQIIEREKQNLRDNIKQLRQEFSINDQINTDDSVEDFYAWVQTYTGLDKDNLTLNSVFERELLNLYAREIEADIYENSIPTKQEEFEDIYNRYAIILDNIVAQTYDNATNKVEEYLKSASNVDVAVRELLENKNNLPRDMREALNILQIGNRNTFLFTARLEAVVDEIKEARIDESEQARRGTSDGNQLTPAQAEIARDNMESKEEDKEEDKEDNEENDEDNGLLSGRDDNPTKDPDDIDDTGVEEIALSFSNLGSPNPDEFFISTFEEIFFASFRDPKTSAKSRLAIEKGPNSAEYKEFMDGIIQYLVFELNVSIEKATAYANTALKLQLPQIARVTYFPEAFRTGAAQILAKLATKKNISEDLSIVEEISDENWVELFLDYIRETYGNNFIEDENGNIHVSLGKIFDRLIQQVRQGDLEIEFVRQFHYQLTKIVEKNLLSDRDIIFDNYKALTKDTNTFINRLIDAATKKELINDNAHAAISKNVSQIDIAKADGKTLTPVYNHAMGNISLTHEGEEIAFLSAVEPNEDKTGYTWRVGKIRIGNGAFRRSIRMEDGALTASTDTFFDELFSGSTDGKRALSGFLKLQRLGRNAKNEDFEKLYNIPFVKKYIEENFNIGEARFITNEDRRDFYRYIIDPINQLSNIIFYENYRENIFFTDNIEDLKISYTNYKKKLWDDAQLTYRLQDSLTKEKPLNLTLKVNAVAGAKLLYSETPENNIADVHLDPKINKLIMVERDRTIKVEGMPNAKINNVAGFAPYSMGMLVRLANGIPFIATISGGAKIKDNNKPLAEALRKEFETILTDYFNTKDPNKINSAFETLKQKLTKLVGYSGNNIFTGYSVDTVGNDLIGLKFGNQKGHYSLVIYKYSRDLKRQSDGTYRDKHTNELIDPKSDKIKKYLQPGAIYKANGNPDAKGKDKIISREKFTNIVKRITDEFVNNVEFNQTFFAFKHEGESTYGHKDDYLYKFENKIRLEIGDYKKEYDSFGELIIANRAFMTTQEISEYGSHFEFDEKSKDVYMTVVETIAPAKTRQDVAAELASKYKNGDRISVEEILSIDNTLSPNKRIALLQSDIVLPTEVYYETDRKDKANAIHKDGKIYITPHGLEVIGQGQSPIRLLVHENIHKYVLSTRFLSGDKGKERVDMLLDTMNQAYEGIKQFANKGDKEANDILDWFELDFLPQMEKVRAKDGDAKVANEWLAEAISQPRLTPMLNRIIYNDSTYSLETTKPKTILAKIIDFLTKLFSIETRYDTVLGQIYNIVNNSKSTIRESEGGLFSQPVEQTSRENKIQEKEDELPNNTQSPVERIESDDVDYSGWNFNREDDDTEYLSVVPEIGNNVEIKLDLLEESNGEFNPNGVMHIENMDDYVNQFSLRDRPLVRSNLASNNVNWNCQ